MNGKDAVSGFQSIGREADKSKLSVEGITTKALGFAAVGGAVVAAGLSMANQFKDTALEAGKLADSTGLAVDDASRWIEVAGDMGIKSDALESSLGKFNKTIGTSPEKLQQFGVDLKRTESGAIDVNGSFLNLIDRLNEIDDPAKRAQLATLALGRGWQSMSELIASGSDRLRASLASVSDAKVIDAAELERAKKFRDVLDQVGDIAQDLTIEIGGEIADAVVGVRDTLQQIADLSPIDVEINIGRIGKTALDLANYPKQSLRMLGAQMGGDVGDGLGGTFRRVASGVMTAGLSEGVRAARNWWSSNHQEAASIIDPETWSQLPQEILDTFVPALKETGDEVLVLESKTSKLAGGMETLAEATKEVDLQRHTQRLADARAEMDRTEQAARDMAGAQRAVEMATADLDRKWRELTDSLSDDEAFLNLQDQFDRMTDELPKDWEHATRESKKRIIDLKQAVIDYAQQVGSIPPEQVTVLNAMIDQGQFDAVEQQLAILTRNRTIAVSLKGIGTGLSGKIGGDRIFADGGTVPGPIGSPQLILAHGGEEVSPTHKWSGRSGSTPQVINLVVDGRVLASVVRGNDRALQ